MKKWILLPLILVLSNSFLFAQIEKYTTIDTLFSRYKIDTLNYVVYTFNNPDTNFKFTSCEFIDIRNNRVNDVPIIYYKNEKIENIHIIKNGKVVISTSFYSNNHIYKTSNYINDTICCDKSYYENGNIEKIQYYFIKDQTICPTRTWYSYYVNGILESKGDYIAYKLKDGEKIFDKRFNNKSCSGKCEYIGLKSGIWLYYNDKGKLIKEEKYFENKVIEVKTY